MTTANRLLCVVVFTLIGGCGGKSDDSPTPEVDTPRPTITPSPTQPPATRRPEPTETPTPTPTVFPTTAVPTASATAAPTSTPSATASPSATVEPDLDGDGFSPARGDCDDSNPANFPGAIEVCDGQDNNCDDLIDEADPLLLGITYFMDADGDDFGQTGHPLQFCAEKVGFTTNDRDCDDNNAAIHPNAFEVCDPEDVDEDCDGYSDDGDANVNPDTHFPYYPDRDEDGFGDGLSTPYMSCDTPTHLEFSYTLDLQDCDDWSPESNPDRAEICDAQDRDCDGVIDEGFDGDGDGTSDCVDDDGDGSTEEAGDCDDSNPKNYPFSLKYPDADWDGRPDMCDNCQWVSNFDQADQNGDLQGDACTLQPGTVWSDPQPLFEVQTEFNDRDPFLTPDGLCLYFSSDRPGGMGGFDIWVSCRTSIASPFSEAIALGVPINSPGFEGQPTLSLDGRELVFIRGEEAGADIFRGKREGGEGRFEAPIALNSLNAEGIEEAAPSFSKDGLILYFISERTGRGDVYQASRLEAGGEFSSPTRVDDVSSSFAEGAFFLRNDGLFALLTTARDTGSDMDIYGVSRQRDSDAFSAPELIPNLSSMSLDGGASLRADGAQMVFFTSREGPFSIYTSWWENH